MIERLGSGAPWESLVGYSRVVAAGPLVEVAGTAAVRDGRIVGEGDFYLQTRTILELIGESLQRAGSDLTQVVRTRLYTVDADRWEDIARAHLEVFGEHRPVTALIEVPRFLDPAMLVEIEATAWRGAPA